MEYADNGDLLEMIKAKKKTNKFFSEDEIMNIFIQVTKGLK